MGAFQGAGVSVGAGIPDFRSSEGLFHTLKRDNPREALSSGKDLFDASVFNVRTLKPFEHPPIRFQHTNAETYLSLRDFCLVLTLRHGLSFVVRTDYLALLPDDRPTLRAIQSR